MGRNTPTGVGKTFSRPSLGLCTQEHPHGRGEDFIMPNRGNCVIGTPPRAWGRLWVTAHRHHLDRNTPTGVGKTPPLFSDSLRFPEHPHGRGEDRIRSFVKFEEVGTPPRAWGRRAPPSDVSRDLRNTPTGVGKTPLSGTTISGPGEHPHGRGEDLG